MIAGNSSTSHFGTSGPDQPKPPLLVRRGAYRRFSRWMDQQLAELEARWGHLAGPNAQRISPPTYRGKRA